MSTTNNIYSSNHMLQHFFWYDRQSKILAKLISLSWYLLLFPLCYLERKIKLIVTFYKPMELLRYLLLFKQRLQIEIYQTIFFPKIEHTGILSVFNNLLENGQYEYLKHKGCYMRFNFRQNEMFSIQFLSSLLYCWHEMPRNEPHCGCYFVVVILAEIKTNFGW